MLFNLISSVPFVVVNMERVITCFNCVIHHTNLIQHRFIKIVSEYDQEIPQSQTADNPVASIGKSLFPS